MADAWRRFSALCLRQKNGAKRMLPNVYFQSTNFIYQHPNRPFQKHLKSLDLSEYFERPNSHHFYL